MNGSQKDFELSIIIPAFNEEGRIGETLHRYLKQYNSQGEIIVVLNGCRDHTLEVVKAIQQKYQDCLKWLDIPQPVGKGGAILEGWKRATGKLIGFVDADGATSPEEFNHLIQGIKDVEGSIASRYIQGAVIKRSIGRRVIGNGFKLITRLLFALPFQDTQCGAKLFRNEVIQDVLPTIKTRDMVFDVDLLYQVVKRGLTVKEIPTAWTEQKGSALFSSNLRLVLTSLRVLISLIRLRLRTFFCK